MPSRSSAVAGTIGGRVSGHVHTSQPAELCSGGGHVSTCVAVIGGGGGGGRSNSRGRLGGSWPHWHPAGCMAKRAGARSPASWEHLHECFVLMRSVMPCGPPEWACMIEKWWQPGFRRWKDALCQHRPDVLDDCRGWKKTYSTLSKDPHP